MPEGEQILRLVRRVLSLGGILLPMAEDMEQAVRNVREGYEAFNRGDYDAAAEHLHPDVVFQRVAEVETSLEGQRGRPREHGAGRLAAPAPSRFTASR